MDYLYQETVSGLKSLQAGTSKDPARDAAEIARIFEELARVFK